MTQKNKRIQSLDFFKGFLIFYIIILHPVIQRVFGQDVSEFENQMTSIPIWLMVIGTPFILISLWGTAFTLLSGTTTAYKMAKTSKNPEKKVRTELQSRTINAILIYFMHFLLVGLFFNQSQDHPWPTHSLITGSIELSEFHMPSFLHFMTSSTLESIAFTSLTISVILFLTWRKNYNYKKAIRNLIILGIAVFGLSILLNTLMPHPTVHAEKLLRNENYLGYYLFSRVHAVRFSFFPVFGFGLVGAIIGIMFAEKQSFKEFAQYLYLIAGGMLLVFGFYAYKGINILEDFAKEHVPLSLQFFNAGLQILVIVGLARLFDFRTSKQKKIRKKSVLGRMNRILKRYAHGSLTVFLLEPLYSIIIYRIFYKINNGTISESPFMIFLYILTIVLSWFAVLKQWAKYRFKYGFEWIVGELKTKILCYRKYNPFVQIPELEMIQTRENVPGKKPMHIVKEK